MAGFSRRKEIVHEIDVAHEHGMPEGRVDRIRLSAAGQRTRAAAAELGDLLATRLHRAQRCSNPANQGCESAIACATPARGPRIRRARRTLRALQLELSFQSSFSIP